MCRVDVYRGGTRDLLTLSHMCKMQVREMCHRSIIRTVCADLRITLIVDKCKGRGDYILFLQQQQQV